MPGKPDIVMRKYRTAIFVNGCFWQTKIARNRERDQRNYDELMHAGWQVIVIWQCKLTKQELETTMQQVAVTLNHNLLKILK